MSSGVQGAASAAPAVADLNAVKTPEDALALLRQTRDPGVAASVQALGEERGAAWREVTLRAERRYGELLGEPKTGRPLKTSQAATFSREQRDAASRARKVWKVDEPVFEAYLADAEKPSRAELLRVADRAKTREALLDDPTLSTRDLKDILGVGESLAGKVRREMEDSGEIPPEHRRARPKTDAPEPEPAKRGRPKNWDGKSNDKRRRELKENQKKGYYPALIKVQLDLNQMCAVLEATDLEGHMPTDEVTRWLVSDIHDDLLTTMEWVDRRLGEVQRWMNDTDVMRKVEALKSRTVERGATEAEQETAQALARVLERKLRSRLTA